MFLFMDAAMNISLLGGKKNIFAHMSKCSGDMKIITWHLIGWQSAANQNLDSEVTSNQIICISCVC